MFERGVMWLDLTLQEKRSEFVIKTLGWSLGDHDPVLH